MSVYILWSPRSQGWLTKSSNYSTDINDARVFNREDAIAMRKKHASDAGYNLLPIRQEDML
jgi:hypothetical protein